MNIDVFISYHTKSSKEITEAVCNELESRKVKCWYAPRDTVDGYANNIFDIINSCKVFLLILNKESSNSFDCISEINLAVDRIRKGEQIHIIPFQVSNEEISGKAKYYLGTFHWIDAITPPLEKRIKELADRICYILDNNYTSINDNNNNNNIKLKSTKVVPTNQFVGRTKELERLDKELANYGQVFLYGMGGIGKSEIVKKYVSLNKDKYDTIIFAVYEKDLISTILDDRFFYINDFKKKITDNGEESDEEFFIRKLNKIKELTDDKTLIIIDNFDIEDDPHLKDLLDGNYNIIFTTRNNYKKLNLPIIEIKAMEDIEDLLELFKENYELPIKTEDKDTIIEIIKYLEGHTLGISLIANVMNESRIKPSKMLEMLKNQDITNIKGNINYLHNNYDSIYSCISMVFNLSNLTDEDKLILKKLYMFPLSGVEFEDFMDLASIEDGACINKLIKRSIIKHDYITDTISLHPLIFTVINNELKPTIKDTHIILNNLLKKYHQGMTEEVFKYVYYIKSIYEKFSNIKEEEAKIYINIVRSYSEYIDLDLAIEIIYKVIEIYENNNNIDLMEIAYLYHDLEYFYYKQFKYMDAIKAIEKDMEISIKCNNREEIFNCYSTLAPIYIDMEDVEKAKFNLDKCFELCNKDYITLSGYYYLKMYEAKICILTKEYDKALKVCDECKKILDDIEDPIYNYRTGALLKIIGQIHVETKEYDKAIEELLKSKEIRSKIQTKDETGVLRVNYVLVDAYINKGEYTNALEILDEMKIALETRFEIPKWYNEVIEKIKICRERLNGKEV